MRRAAQGRRGGWDVGGESVEDGLELGTCDRRDYDKVTMEEGTRDMAELKRE